MIKSGLSRTFPRLRVLAQYSTKAGGAGEPAGSEAAKAHRKEHIERLRKYYPDELIAPILAAETSVSPEAWANRKPNNVEFGPIYADDFSTYHPLFDFAKHDWLDKSQPWQPIPKQIPSGVALEPEVMSSKSASAVNITKLEQLTGLSADFINSLTVRQITRKRVVNMTKKGKMPSFYSLAIVGDRNGHVGVGEGKDPLQPALALSRAHWNAVKNLTFIPRFENRTIYGEIQHKYHSVLINLRPAPPGSGLRVNHVIYEICKAAGIKDLGGNIYRSRNPMNVTKGVVEALSTKQSILEDIAASRGKKIVDVTNSYYNF